MGKPGFVRNAQEDSEPWRALRRWLDSQQHAEIGMRCGKSYPHAQHTWQMSATGWCACDGRESTPIYDGLVNARSSQF